jgi:hypothetical protein
MFHWPGSTTLYRLLNNETGDHVYTSTPPPWPDGYHLERIECRLPACREEAAVPLWRLDRLDRPDHIYTPSTRSRGYWIEQGWADAGSPGCVFTAARAGTIPFYEARGPRRHVVPRDEQGSPHFYTRDRAEAQRAVNEDDYAAARLICHVLPPPLDTRTKRRLFLRLGGATVVLLSLVVLAGLFGDVRWVQRVAAGWAIIVTGAAISFSLAGWDYIKNRRAQLQAEERYPPPIEPHPPDVGS